jgi:hypothetical protein
MRCLSASASDALTPQSGNADMAVKIGRCSRHESQGGTRMHQTRVAADEPGLREELRRCSSPRARELLLTRAGEGR